MPTVDQIEDKNGNLFDIEDANAQTKIGDLAELKTASKTNLVSALNETLTPSQIETITVPLGTVNFYKLGRLVKMEMIIRLPQDAQIPLKILEHLADKYIPLTNARVILLNNSRDTPCGQVVVDANSKEINLWFAQGYQAIVGDAYVCESLYIAKS